MGIGGILKGLLPLAGPIGGIASSAIDMFSQQHANKSNADNVQKQMDFQRQMSNTAYQRGTKDMEAAGLNPALAYQQGGASSQPGATATVQPLAQNTASKFATALDTYQTIASGAAQRELLREQATAAGASARLSETQAAIGRPEAIAGRDEGYVSTRFRTLMAENFQRREAATNYPARFRADIANIGANTASLQAQAQRARSETTLNEQLFQNDFFRQKIAPYLNSTNAASTAARNLLRRF